MSNALTTFMANAQLPATTDDELAKALASTVADAGGTSSGLNYLGFSGKTGVYSLGKNKDDITDEMLFLVEPAGTIAGWTCWKENEAKDKHKWLSTDAARNPDLIVKKGELDEHGPYREGSGDGWKPMMGVGLMELSDMSTSVEFSTTAVSAINGLKDLIAEASKRLLAKEPAMPIIWMGREKFTAQGKENWKPTFNVDIWVERAAVGAFIEGKLSEDDLIRGKAPRKKRGK
jgi:hypothetical protein